MRRPREPAGPYISRDAPAYPAGMNLMLAQALGRAVRRASLEQPCSSSSRCESVDDARAAPLPPSAILPRVEFRNVLRHVNPAPKEVRRAEDEESLGGMRNVAKTVRRLPRHEQLGRILSPLFDGYLRDFPSIKEEIISSLDSNGKDQKKDFIGPDHPAFDECRCRLAVVLGGKPSTEPCSTETCSTSIRGHLLHRWASVAGDPAAHVCRWRWAGAPAGIAEDPALDSVFPKSHKADIPANDPDDFITDLDSFCNFSSLKEDDESANEISASGTRAISWSSSRRSPCATI